jgi:hypothetical protein
MNGKHFLVSFASSKRFRLVGLGSQAGRCLGGKKGMVSKAESRKQKRETGNVDRKDAPHPSLSPSDGERECFSVGAWFYTQVTPNGVTKWGRCGKRPYRAIPNG